MHARSSSPAVRCRVLVIATLAMGCAMPVAPEAAAVHEASLVQDNGEALNGRTLNGRTLNGRTLNGRTLNGRTLNGVSLGGIELAGGTLVGTTAAGVGVGGLDLLGAELSGTLEDGTPVSLTIEDIEPDALDADLLHYLVSFRMDPDAAPEYACGRDGSGAPVTAVPLAGRWDYGEGTTTGGSHLNEASSITLACAGAVLAKCVEMGYAPWRTVVERFSRVRSHPVSLASLHQACTRMLRADYCGDGSSHTLDGEPIEVWDAFGVQAREVEVRWAFEAEWTTAGARCKQRERIGDGLDYIAAHCPDRWDGWADDDRCGSRRSDLYTVQGFDVPLDVRSLLMDETSSF
jgi:ADYC domain-containing protein